MPGGKLATLRLVVKNGAPPSASIFDHPAYMCSPDVKLYEQPMRMKGATCVTEVRPCEGHSDGIMSRHSNLASPNPFTIIMGSCTKAAPFLPSFPSPLPLRRGAGHVAHRGPAAALGGQRSHCQPGDVGTNVGDPRQEAAGDDCNREEGEGMNVGWYRD